MMTVNELSKILNIDKNDLKKRLYELDRIFPLTKKGFKGIFNIQEHEIDVIKKYLNYYHFFNDEKQALKLFKDEIEKYKEEEWIRKIKENIK